MDAGAPAWDSRLLDKDTFLENFNNEWWPKKTYLCYEMELPGGASGVPLGQDKGVLRNRPFQPFEEDQESCHAELCLLQRIGSWELASQLRYRVTCFLSWSPCPACALELARFLVENKHVSLSLFASRLYTKAGFQDGEPIPLGYEAGLRILRDAGARIAIMSSTEFEHCWRTFVDNQGEAFEPWDTLASRSQELSEQLRVILEKPVGGFQSHQRTQDTCAGQLDESSPAEMYICPSPPSPADAKQPAKGNEPGASSL